MTAGPSPETVDTETPAAPHRRPRLALAVLLGVVFVCAACGLAYELALISLGSFLIGNTATQASIVLSVMVFAMGVGSLAAKPLQARAAVAFAVIELALALIGGLSVLLLYFAFAYLSIYTGAMIVVAFVLGLLIGAEIPLLMVLLQRIRKQEAGSAVADMFAADYVGALIGGLSFPFLLLPVFGQLRGAIVVGLVNAVAGAVLVFFVFGPFLKRTARVVLGVATLLVIAILATAALQSQQFEVSARQALYRDPIVASVRTPYQEIVITERRTGAGPDTRLFLNGDLQFSSADEYRYHEALVHPAMSALPARGGRVLVLGGGDGLALREVLRYPNLDSATLVELDPEMIRLSRTDSRLTALNRGSLDDPRAHVRVADAFSWVRENADQFDVIIVDMPDPDDTATAKLYSTEFYGMVRAHLKPNGVMTVQSGSPYFAPKSFWCIGATLEEAGLQITPYHVDVPSFGDWGFHLAAPARPALTMSPPAPLRFLDAPTLQAAATFPADRSRLDLAPSTLMDPRILRYAQAEWTQY